MSTGRTHTRASLILSGTFLVGTLFTGNVSDVQYAFGAALGVMLSPDLDVDNKNISYKYIRSIGNVFEFIWGWLWYPYRKSLKHGGNLSHDPIIGTLGRIIFLFYRLIVIPEVILSVSGQVDFWNEMQWWAWKMILLWKIWIGLAGADLIHFVLDIATTNVD
jgi:uncharacterized metal-binding protein